MTVPERSPVDRHVLYEEVWAEPVTVVAERYGLSDVGLAKICRSLSIPIPSRGYWAQVKAGKVMSRPPLPPFTEKVGGAAKVAKLPEEQIKARREKKEVMVRRQIDIVDALTQGTRDHQHPLVKATEVQLRKLDAKLAFENKGVLPAPKTVLDIAVSTAAISRALRLVDTLFAALASLSFEVKVNSDTGGTFLRTPEGEVLGFSVKEIVKRSPHEVTKAERAARDRYYEMSRRGLHAEYNPIPQYDYLATGNLHVEICGRFGRSWKDTDKTRLEQRIPQIIEGILVIAQETHERELEEARRKSNHERAVLRYKGLMELRTRELEQLKALEKDAALWQRALQIRAYADAAELRAIAEGGCHAALEDWLAWARAKADSLDPLIPVCDPILGGPEPKDPGRFW